MSASRHVRGKALFLWWLLIAAAWVGGSRLLQGVDEKLFSEIGRLLGWGAAENVQLHRPGEPIATREIVEEKRRLLCPLVGTVSLHEEATRDCFAALPLGPQDMAVLLRYLSRSGATTLGISSPLTWQDESGDMARQMFCQSMGSFRHAVLGLRGHTAAQADFTPVVLRHYAIPEGQVEGDSSGLPSANKALPNGLAATPDALQVAWAPDWLEDEPLTQRSPSLEQLSLPLLVRWNGEIMPTLPLRLALERLGLTPADVSVRLGKDIRFAGRSLPLDEHGRTRLTHARTRDIPLSEVVRPVGETAKEDAGNPAPHILATLNEDGCVILGEPLSGKADPARLTRLAATFSQLAGKEKVEYVRTHRPVGSRVLELSPHQQGWLAAGTALISLGLALWLLPWLPAWLRYLLMLALLVGLLRESTLQAQEGMWFSLAASLLCWLLTLVALPFLKPVERGLFSRRR